MYLFSLDCNPTKNFFSVPVVTQSNTLSLFPFHELLSSLIETTEPIFLITNISDRPTNCQQNSFEINKFYAENKIIFCFY